MQARNHAQLAFVLASKMVIYVFCGFMPFCPDEFETEIAVIAQKAGPAYQVNGNSHDHYYGHIITANIWSQLVFVRGCA